MTEIHDSDGYFIAPAPMYQSYKTVLHDALEKRCNAILKKYRTADFLQYTISNDPVITYKNKKKGRPAKGEIPEQVPVRTDNFSINLDFNQVEFEEELARCGFYPLITNKPEHALSIEEAMLAHKNQYKCEHINRRAKSSLNLEPIYLQTPERIEAMLFCLR